MYLKRIYKESGELDYIALAHTGVRAEQHFSIQLVTNGLETGLMEIHDGELFLKVHPETLRYTIVREPGHYCLHCGEKLSSDESGALARLHVAKEHPGLARPGYERINYFDCVLDAGQHEKFHKKDRTSAPRFHLKEK